ncbi:MAG: 2-C-methyl-D-erythritol 2,4-cyclodiphosphate synthase [Candidatus Fimenecus sp.]
MFRIGYGYDVHKLVKNRKLILGGVEIENNGIGLLGHSDADVLCHAITDAVLGAAALGDIGKYFPDNDKSFKDADSLVLLNKAIEILKKNGYKVINVDASILLQSPKIAPYIISMRKNLAEAIGIEVDFISVKATTEEGLGFTGRKEGIAVNSVVLIEKI